MTKEELFRDMYATLSSSMWKCLHLLDQGRFSELRESLLDAIEESEDLIWNSDLGPLDMEEILRENSRRH